MIARRLAILALLPLLWAAWPEPARAAVNDFALGKNTESEACRAVTRFDPPKGGGAADVYCGAWENPSGRVIFYPSQAAAQAAEAEVCPGAATALSSPQFDSLSQIACARTDHTGGVIRYAMVAKRGDQVAIGEVYPADWQPMVDAARVMLGIEPPAAITVATGITPGLREIQAVFPDGPPGQAAEANYELLLRRAYEYNTIWSFDAAEKDFQALLAAHNKVAPDDAAGQAEIFADIALNMSNARRFAEADDAFVRATGLLTMPKDALLASKILNYKALDRLNHRDYAAGLALALRANEMRADLAKAALAGSGAHITEGDVGRVRRGDAAGSGERSMLIALSQTPSADRATILTAQGNYIAAIAVRSLGQPGEGGYLAAAAGALDQVVSPPGWLVENVANEQADYRYVAGDFAGSATAAQAGLALIKTTQPGTRAEAHLWLSLEQAQTAMGRIDDALTSGRAAMAIFSQQTERPGLPADIAAPHLALLEQLWRQTNDPKLAAEYFQAMSLIWDSSAARTSAQLAARMSLGASGGQARAYQDADRTYRATLARQQLLVQSAGAPPAKLAAAAEAVKVASKQLASTEASLRAHAPSYLELLNPAASSADLQGVMADGEAYLRIVTGERGGFGVLVDKAGVKPYRIALNQAEIDKLANRLRQTTRLRGRMLPDFDIEASQGLYQGLLGPVADRLADDRNLDIDVAGSLASIPFAALVERAPDEGQLKNIHENQDYSGVAWLARRMAVSNTLGPASLIRLRKSAPPPPTLPQAVLYGDYSRDPSTAAARLAVDKDLSQKCQGDVQHALSLLGPLPETSQEVTSVAANFPGAHIVLGSDFTDIDFLSNPRTADADFIMVATHGVLGLSNCVPEPGLLTSLGPKGSGLIEASALLDRGLKAQLVVLSACDTAAGGALDEASGGLGDGGDALSGLARGFIYAGARNVLVTEWKVDAAASSAEMVAFVGAAKQPGVDLGQALATAQRQLFGQAETGHPFYWAAFIVVGDGARPLTAATKPTVAATAPATTKS